MTKRVERFELARQAQEVGLVVTCLRPHPGLPGGALYEVELWCEDGTLWARATYAAPELIREMVGQYAELQVRRSGAVGE